MQVYRALAAALVILTGGCAADDPEAALVALVEDAEHAAESRDSGFFRALVADSYLDAHGNDRDGLIGRIRGYFLANRTVEVLTRVERVALRGTDAAELTVLAGVLGRRPGAGLLAGLDGRIYRLELEAVRRGGEWQVIGADWESAMDAEIGQ